MILTLKDNRHHLARMLDENDCPACSVKIIGKPLIVHNVSRISAHEQIEKILVPSEFSAVSDMIQRNFPSLSVNEYSGSTSIPNEGLEAKVMQLGLSSIVTEAETGKLAISDIVYPWDILAAMDKILQSEVKERLVSENASISETSVIKGPCVIEDGVFVDDFCKIKGPVYLGKNSRVGTGSLVRNCMVGPETTIGFNCEVARTYLAGRNRIAHHNVILDSIIGQNSWLGGYVGTTNVLLNNKNVRYKIGDQLVDTGMQQFGAVIGRDSAIGAGVIILPGRCVPPQSIVQAGKIVE